MLIICRITKRKTKPNRIRSSHPNHPIEAFRNSNYYMKTGNLRQVLNKKKAIFEVYQADVGYSQFYTPVVLRFFNW